MSIQVYKNGVIAKVWDENTRTVTDYTQDPPATRPYTPEENAAADARISQEVMFTDLQARLERIEAALWPAPPDPEDPEDPTIPEWTDWNGVWPANTLLRDGGKVWRNVASVPLTTRPTEFPGGTGKWAHLFVGVGGTATEPEPEPEPNPEYPQWKGEWNKDSSYVPNDHVSRNGVVYKCLIAHGAAYQGTWGPPATGVWVVVRRHKTK